VVVTYLGFTAAGVTAGSAGAWLMSFHGGTIASGSLVSGLQSIGAAGMGPVGTIAGAVGGVVAAAVASAVAAIA